MVLQKKMDNKEDYLDIDKIIQYLTPVIESITQPFVIALNSPYGTGKTFLIEKWKEQLSSREDGIKTVYFNAWATDYSQDAFVAFIRRN